MPTSNEDSTDPPKGGFTFATPSTALGSTASYATTAEATNAIETTEPNDENSELGSEPGKKVKSIKTSANKEPQVRKSSSPTPSRTRSGLIRQPSKRPRAVIKITKKKSVDKERPDSQATTSTSTAGTTSEILNTQSITNSLNQNQNLVHGMSGLSLQSTWGHNTNEKNANMPKYSTLPSNSITSMAPTAHQKNLCTNTMNASLPGGFQPRYSSFNQTPGFSLNSVQPPRSFNFFSNEQRPNFLNANAQPFCPPTCNPLTSSTTQTTSCLSSSNFPNNYPIYSVPYLSNANNPPFFHQNTSFQAPTFMLNNNAMSFNTNSRTADINLSDSQVAARQAISKDLPTFSGRPEEWPVFITNYMQSTERCGFTEQENLIRLQKSLKGQALEAVRGKLMMPATVNFAIETLRMLYGRPEMIHHALQKGLREQPTIRKEKLDTLIHFALAVQNYRTTMQAMGLDDYLNDPMLLDDLVQKLPCDLKLDWGRYRCTLPKVDIVLFDGWLYNLATCASFVTPFLPSSQFECKRSTKERLHLHEVVDANSGFQTKLSCFKCFQNHRLSECPEFLLLTVNERWNLIRRLNLCLRCFKKHSLRRCHSKRQCDVDNCKMPHNPLLHEYNKINLNSNSNKPRQQANQGNTSMLFHAKENKALFRYVPVIIFGKSRSLNTFALIDEGSSCTLIEEALALELGLDGPTEELCLQWTGEITQTDENSRIVSMQISSREQPENKMTLRDVRTISNLDLPLQTLTVEEINSCSQFENLPILPYNSVKPKLIIGIDNAKLCVPLETKESTNDGLIAIRSRVGWGVYGRQCVGNSSLNRIMHICSCGMYSRMDELLKNYFSLESVGIKFSTNPLRSKEDEAAKLIMEKTTKYNAEERIWTTGLLWKYKDINFPDSLPMAKRRLLCLETKMNKEPELKKFLIEKMKDYEQKGYIRKLKPNEILRQEKTWYIPIFTVQNKNKGKTRIVWDAAAAVGKVSLNSVLLKGPDLMKSLVGVLIRFREKPFAISGDIREMFHQIRVIEEDQCAQQLLWREGNPTKKIEVYVMTVLTFGASCSPSLANFVKNKNAERFSEQFPEAVHSILNNTFVDDWLQSSDSEEELLSMAKVVRKIHSDGGFEMRNWLSNSKKAINSLNCCNSNDQKCFENSEDNFEKVLGMWWIPSIDELTFVGRFDSHVFDKNVVPTKRGILRLVMTIFDPLGLLGHFIIFARILLQEVWRSRVGWDEPLCEEESAKWWTWVELLPSITDIRIPRCHKFLSCSTNIELHTFVDASIDAYAAVAYLRVVYNGITKCSLVSSKTRVAPLKPISIPKLELMAAVIGMRLANFVLSEMSIKVNARFFWSDSKDVLYWIRSDARKYQQFVSLRVGEILEGSQVKEWRWLPSAQNVADEATKWKSLPNMKPDSRWFLGPPFLYLEETQWPISEFIDRLEEIPERLCHIEVKTPMFTLSTIMPDPNKFSKWEKFRRGQQLVLQYIGKIIHPLRLNLNYRPFVQDAKLESVELFIFKACQEETFYEEISVLKLNKCLSKRSLIYKCAPYLDDWGVLRVKGRIDAIQGVPIDVKRPIILHPKHRITHLLIDFYHRKYCHHHNEIIVNEIRQKFWITGLRAAVRSSVKTCQMCKNRKVVPSAPEMADLPIERLSPFTTPFHYTGVDYFGPFEVIIGRRKEKRWGVLFTCMTVRAVHIEVASSLSTDSFLMVFTQFTARRGVPQRIISDNATNFRGASRLLQQEIDKVPTKELERKYPEIEWVFIPPSSPHMGGSWERMIRSTKSILMDILPEGGLREEVLRASLAEVENILNSRPLTYVPLESPESEALTPNHFLIGSSSGARNRAVPNGSGLALNKNFRISTAIADCFWKRWLREVLPCLARRTKWYQKSESTIEVNDVVIIVDENSKRNSWAKGIVVDVHPGKNNVVRSAVVKTKNGLVTRPVIKLAKLDVIK